MCVCIMNLLTSEQENHTLESNPYDDDDDQLVFSSQDPSVAQHKPKERKKWSHTEDLVLISAWLNTSKNAVVRNDKKSNAFWSRIAAYYAASPKVAGLEKRKATHCKPRWQKINDQVCKFVASYEAATKEISNGQNEDDIIKLAYEIFFNDYKVKFTLEHAWRELRHEQKWCGSSSTKDNGAASKRRKIDDQSSSYVLVEEDQARPPGVKASKGKAKKSVSKTTTAVQEEGNSLFEFKSMWEIKKKDLEIKERISKNKLLHSLLAKTEPLSEIEMALKNKLITDMLSNS